MNIPSKYLHDRAVLLLESINVVLAALTIITVILHLQGTSNEGYIVQYRSNLGLNAFKVGGLVSVLSLIAFAVMVLALHTVISIRTYMISKALSVGTLAFGTLLLTLTLIISNSLLLLAR